MSPSNASSKLFGAWVPGLPHFFQSDTNLAYGDLHKACLEVGESFRKHEVKRILYYSTQWLSVLGHSVQSRPNPKGQHVDENWYDIATLKFDLNVDTKLASSLVTALTFEGYQARSVDYEGFPIDTGTIVAESLLNKPVMNKSQIPVSILSSCVYSDYNETKKLGTLARQVLADLPGASAIVVVSGLSGRFFTQEIDLREDHISDANDDELNKQLLRGLTLGQWSYDQKDIASYCKATKADMGLKALAFLEGAGLAGPGKQLIQKAYGAIYGTGAAVMTTQNIQF
jgi:2-aminophenol/2-amino-5-chlorophenol 1,6-dioxygenase alpha subunit